MTKLRLLELFGGIGACSKALERLGIDYEIVDYVEIDKHACASYNAIHNTNFEPQDITTWDKNVDIDLIMHGSPCQDFSLAGKQAGGDEGSGTRSSLMYETIRIVKKLRPKYVIWENVKNLLSKKHKHNFDAYLKTMEGLGYINYYQVLNAKDYGIPQNRERVFTISIYDDIDYDTDFEFPKPQPLKKKLKDMLEKNVDEKYYLTEEKIDGIPHWKSYQKSFEKSLQKQLCEKLINENKVKEMDVIRHSYSISRMNNFRTENSKNNNLSPTLDTRCDCLGVTTKHKNQLRIRKLTPKECWRLMGFDDSDFEKAEKVNSNAQLYKQAGNSIVVNVLEEILKNLLF